MIIFGLWISIHASAREATGHPLDLSVPYTFQSTPPRGRRRDATERVQCDWNFNPRLREGGDHCCTISQTAVAISIHASAREATGAYLFTLGVDTDFNPRLREGGDMYQKSAAHMQIDFNPRLREGGDDTLRTIFGTFFDISIHASAREATEGCSP